MQKATKRLQLRRISVLELVVWHSFLWPPNAHTFIREKLTSFESQAVSLRSLNTLALPFEQCVSYETGHRADDNVHVFNGPRDPFDRGEVLWHKMRIKVTNRTPGVLGKSSLGEHHREFHPVDSHHAVALCVFPIDAIHFTQLLNPPCCCRLAHCVEVNNTTTAVLADEEAIQQP